MDGVKTDMGQVSFFLPGNISPPAVALHDWENLPELQPQRGRMSGEDTLAAALVDVL